MGFFTKKEPEVVYYSAKDYDCCGPEPSPPKVYVDYERKFFYMDIVKTGLSNLIAVDEVLYAAKLALADYDMHFGPPAPEAIVPDEFFEHDDEALTVA